MHRQSDFPEEKKPDQLIKNLNEIMSKKNVNELNSILYFKNLSDLIEKTRDKWESEEALEDIVNIIFLLAIQNNSYFIKEILSKDKNFFTKYEFPKQVKTMLTSPSFENKDLIYWLIAKNSVETLDLIAKETDFKFTIDHLKDAIENQAEWSVHYLLTKVQLNEEQALTLARLAKRLGNIAIINELIPLERAHLFYFEEILHLIEKNKPIEKEDFYFAISNAYRNSNIQNVEQIYQNFLAYVEKHYPHYSDPLQMEARNAKENFPKWASQIARYRTRSDIFNLKKSYNATSSIKDEMKRGLSNFQIIDEVCSKDFKFPPCRQDINEYYPDCEAPKNFVSMKTLFSYLVDKHAEEAKDREFLAKSSFNELNTLYSPGLALGTFCTGNYSNMVPFIELLALEEKYNSDKKHDFHYSDIDKDFKYNQSYDMYFNKTLLSRVDFCHGEKMPFWQHGLANRDESSRFLVWQEMEKIHKSIFEMDSKKIPENPKEFYDQIITLIWLMGNLTPMCRGTGRYVEQILALAHHFHHLPIPVLKPGFQLDCLNITMPLEIYKKTFLHFMEFDSLMPSAKKLVEQPVDSALSKDFLSLIEINNSPNKESPAILKKQMPSLVKHCILSQVKQSILSQKKSHAQSQSSYWNFPYLSYFFKFISFGDTKKKLDYDTSSDSKLKKPRK